jgi:hypothetical protein
MTKQQNFASHEVVNEGWAAGGAQEALYRAITQTGQWWSSVASGIADGRTAKGVLGQPGYTDGGRPDIPALLAAAIKEKEGEGQHGAGPVAPASRL